MTMTMVPRRRPSPSTRSRLGTPVWKRSGLCETPAISIQVWTKSRAARAASARSAFRSARATASAVPSRSAEAALSSETRLSSTMSDRSTGGSIAARRRYASICACSEAPRLRANFCSGARASPFNRCDGGAILITPHCRADSASASAWHGCRRTICCQCLCSGDFAQHQQRFDDSAGLQQVGAAAQQIICDARRSDM